MSNFRGFSRTAMTPLRFAAGAIAMAFWLYAVATFLRALAHQDQFGFVFLRPLALSFPWSQAAYPLTSIVPQGNPQVVAFAAIVFVGAGINARILYVALVFFGHHMRRRRQWRP
jgi:hypothetical protein